MTKSRGIGRGQKWKGQHLSAEHRAKIGAARAGQPLGPPSTEHRAKLAAASTKHGLYKSPTYLSWEGMIGRTTNPRHAGWAYYGGRGIIVCDRWRTFENFMADMGERPAGLTLDRKDNDGNYELGNCRWATRLEQTHNRRPSTARPPRLICLRGHPLTPENSYVYPSTGWRKCRQCMKIGAVAPGR